MRTSYTTLTAAAISLSLLAGCGANAPTASQGKTAASGVTELTFYYPVAVAGPLAKIMESYVNEFNQSHPNIHVQAVYSGDYGQTKTKVLAAANGGNMPDVAVMGATEVLGLKDADAIVPLDAFINKDSDGEAYVKDFFPAYMPKIEGNYWSVPFQRSTPVLYYNKDAFKAAGLDPNKPPANWNELEEDAKKLTKRDASGQVSQWGVLVGADDTWIIQGFIMQGFNEPKRIFNDAGNKVDYNNDSTKKALNFFIKLGKEDKVMPDTIVNGGTFTSDFVSGKAAMMFYSTGGLGFVRENAKFEFGTAFLPAGNQYATPTGGGSMYMLNTKNEAKEKATWEFMRWMTTPERAAKWSIDSGYVATRQSAYEVPVFQEYAKKYPQALVARDQLKYAQTELTTHNNGEVLKIMGDAQQGIFLGKIPMDQGLTDAQSKIDKALQPFVK
ncbi:ABC transporter substrate-binding protein [Paenibacillus filicis]|uniref:ABC transporter substrate-binding protein n=1 Tax=Paenibacillus gyeongsangnamensis TaxID=3388067 RepID=A0ABT4QFI4_9BACL|nr:ABC transporter substrate-binding protein [Paenibacillus filicis]MCZ8515455.1 ABC transporter substrate-binding protein [Paenibacillus filicis]